MKKIILIAATAFASLTSFANADPITGKVLAAFRSQFSEAKNVQWVSLEDAGLYQATFNFQNCELNAFYDQEGELVATARYISKANLPIMASKKIADRFPEYIIQNVIEHNSKGETIYYVTLAGMKASIIAAVSPGGSLSVFKKVKK